MPRRDYNFLVSERYLPAGASEVDFAGDETGEIIGYPVWAFRYYESGLDTLDDAGFWQQIVSGPEADNYLMAIWTEGNRWRWSSEVAIHDALYRVDQTAGEIGIRLQTIRGYDHKPAPGEATIMLRVYPGWDERAENLAATIREHLPGESVGLEFVDSDVGKTVALPTS